MICPKGLKDTVPMKISEPDSKLQEKFINWKFTITCDIYMVTSCRGPTDTKCSTAFDWPRGSKLTRKHARLQFAQSPFSTLHDNVPITL